MAAKKLVLAFCALGFLQTSFAGFDRFWIFSKDTKSQVNENWDSLSDDEQKVLIKKYQSMKELPANQNDTLQQRMDWFNQLPDKEKQQMREAWQQMSTHERNEMKQKMAKATTSDQRAEIRNVYLHKYIQNNITNTAQ
ncbi:DUF3106 domain-containing protein [Acinetobacter gerneri]|uniref:DUF3106 domain-containing protein n=1 Tax=Acinetobacter gerneri TaxID=202952 RepID=UPI002935FFCA|nr:DUF3106 domain-containing protein [Acinetobacter gerneri]MDV2440304.1 DUF3106 domain-containing protein [Acinetobacter gerneri]